MTQDAVIIANFPGQKVMGSYLGAGNKFSQEISFLRSTSSTRNVKKKKKKKNGSENCLIETSLLAEYMQVYMCC